LYIYIYYNIVARIGYSVYIALINYWGWRFDQHTD